MQIDFVADPVLYPFESKWFASSAGRVHYIDEGSGPPILFCHGNPTWSFLYRRIVAQLRDRFRCVAVDYLGFGLSDRPAAYGYTVAEQARIVGELVDHLGLDGFVPMVQDWGGPIGATVATERAVRVRGMIVGNTWFWPADLRMRLFSRAMATRFFQRRILERNVFIEHVMPAAMTHRLTAAELEHYRRVQPNPAARRGMAELPKEICAARPLLERLARDVPDRLGDKPALLVWGMKDPAFPRRFLTRMRSIFADHVVVELADARHYLQEDAPEQISAAILARFG